jgi:carbon storage regulator
MLVLSRKIGESIIIDERIVVDVVRIAGRVVRLGVTAPRELNIRRAELPAAADADLPALRPQPVPV